MMNNFQRFANTQPEVSMNTNPTLLMEIAGKLGIIKPGDDKEKLVAKVNIKLNQYKKQINILSRAAL